MSLPKAAKFYGVGHVGLIKRRCSCCSMASTSPARAWRTWEQRRLKSAHGFPFGRPTEGCSCHKALVGLANIVGTQVCRN